MGNVLDSNLPVYTAGFREENVMAWKAGAVIFSCYYMSIMVKGN